MNKIKELEEIFSQFPGVGPRQAKRFVYFLLLKKINFSRHISSCLEQIHKESSRCKLCNRFFVLKQQSSKCQICLDKKRQNKILILEKDSDFENIENSGLWQGKYFLIGRNLKINEKNKEEFIDLQNLLKNIENQNIEEIVFALSLNPEGENTRIFLEEKILDFKKSKKLKTKISKLARGLSLGSEIEYADKITLKEAFKNR